jgi:gamma-glutamylcyclotransferase (GGCT)/AIG2-like uncharacterized protein YtfP
MINALAVYGTLAPGAPNHGVIADIPGTWIKGTVNGYLHNEGWAAEQGYPAITLEPDGPELEVDLLVSDELDKHLTRLDDFEGWNYKRVTTEVETAHGMHIAFIYELAS